MYTKRVKKGGWEEGGRRGEEKQKAKTRTKERGGVGVKKQKAKTNTQAETKI
jgi:hypothetical protein